MSARYASTGRYRLPRGLHLQADGSVVCSHRDVSCCPACVAAHAACVVVVASMAFFVRTDAEAAELRAMARDDRT